MRNGRKILDGGYFYSRRGQRSDGALTPVPRAPKVHFDFSYSRIECHFSNYFGCYSRRKGCTFSRSFKSRFSRSIPGNYIAAGIGDINEGIVECCPYVGDTFRGYPFLQFFRAGTACILFIHSRKPLCSKISYLAGAFFLFAMVRLGPFRVRAFVRVL